MGHWIAVLQIGDGFIVVRPNPGNYQLLFKPDKGEFANQTTFVTADHAAEDMQVVVLEASPVFICAATDGLERVAIRFSDWAPYAPFFQPFEDYLTETPDPEQNPDYLEQFLTSERLNARTTDDKTMLLAQLIPVVNRNDYSDLHQNPAISDPHSTHSQ